MSSLTPETQSRVEPDEQVQRLVARYQAPLRAYFRKRINNPADVDDLVQTLFLRLLDREETHSFDNAEAYIFQTASNLLRDRYRRQATRRRFEVGRENEGERIEEISPERVLTGREDVRAVQKALLELPERTRTIFMLQRFEHFKYREIADRLGISVSSVEKHMASALAQIFTRLGKEK